MQNPAVTAGEVIESRAREARILTDMMADESYRPLNVAIVIFEATDEERAALRAILTRMQDARTGR